MEKQKLLNFSWLVPGKIAGHGKPMSIDDLKILKMYGIKALVRMTEEYEAEVTNVEVTSVGLIDYLEPVANFTAPTQSQIDKMIKFIDDSLSEGHPVGVSCGAGLGRTGTILAAFLVSQGNSASDAISEVRKKRPGSIETKGQEDAVTLFEICLTQIPPTK